MTTINSCDPILHGGERVPAPFLVMAVERRPNQHGADDYRPTIGSWGMSCTFACCAEHLGDAIDQVASQSINTSSVLVRSSQ